MGDLSPRWPGPRREKGGGVLARWWIYPRGRSSGWRMSAIDAELSPQTYPQHWSLVHRLVKQLDCRVVFPMYTLSPFSTAAAWDRVASDLIVQIAQDPRYRSMEIVFMGDSAGGWMVLRLLNLLCELGLEGDEKKVAHVVRTLERITTAILISPVLSFQIDEATEQAAKGVSKTQCWSSRSAIALCLHLIHQDYWVGLNRLHVYMPLWAYGPTAVPAIAARVPSAAKSKNSWPDVQLPLSHPCYSPINGIEVLERYKLAYPEQPTFRIVSFIGTGDMLWPTTVSLHERLLKLGPDIVTSDITLVRLTC